MSNFSINAKVKLNTGDIQKQLDKIRAKQIDMSKSSKSVDALGTSFGSLTKRVTEFYSATKVVKLFENAIVGTAKTVKEFNDTVTDFKKVSDLSGDSLTAYTKKLGELGLELGRTRTEMVASATKFKQGGYSDADTVMLTEVAELYRNIADEAISSGDSASFVISQMKAFNIEAKDSITIIDAVNEVANKFAVSSSDISEGLTKSSASLAVYGNDINETIALVSAG